ncbi:hypothetical protein NP493_2233g00002 [Ridgeia piscesae]|uniref:Uncharacterized protein n=1 Tax=Ridgeia piscesae TaxID=27915 RepID=A0AAD9JKB9_RIDPI|nr:hypothetical protein NP493_2233g00002 [Ridgeia piscesae]
MGLVTGLIIGLAVGLVTVLTLAVFVIIFLCRKYSHKTEAELRKDKPSNTDQPVDTNNLGGGPEYDYINLDNLDGPQDRGNNNEVTYGPYSTITEPGVSDRNPYENINSSTAGREPRVTDEIPADAVMEEMDGYGEYGTGGHI